MNVAQLIKTLQKLPQDIDVVVWSDRGMQYVDIKVDDEANSLIATENGLLLDDGPPGEALSGESVNAVIIGICD